VELNALNAGTVIIRATIENGIAEGTDYVQDFSIIVFEPIGIDENDFAEVVIYSHFNTVYIKTVGVRRALPLPTVEIFDMYGRLVYQCAINNDETVITLPVAEGIYNVVLRGGRDGARPVSTKVLIR